MSDYDVHLNDDNMQELYINFKGPSESMLSFLYLEIY